jgi:dihydrofolate reductase
MRKIIVEAEVSLDGIVNSPEIWLEIFQYHTDDVTDYLNKLLFSSDALLLGRLTYEIFADEGKTFESGAILLRYGQV